MCGIARCFGTLDTKTINKMLDAMTHRGPDDRGVHTFNNTTFGHTRLSIVDVARGHQPILTDGGRTGIICNGEIYNHLDIRKKLISKYEYQTQSDTESILHLYKEKGPRCVEDLDSMFAFAVSDGDNYMLARDTIGAKPLYYGYIGDRMYFASELDAMSLAGLETAH